MQVTRFVLPILLCTGFSSVAMAQNHNQSTPSDRTASSGAESGAENDNADPNDQDDEQYDDDVAIWTDYDDALSDEDFAALAGETIIMVDDAPVIADAPGKTRLVQEELSTIPGARGDAIDAVKTLPGVAQVSGFGGAGDLVVRGSSPEDTLYLVDGIEIPLAQHFGGLQTVLPTTMLDDVSLSPGAFAAEFGRATGGVVQLRTRPSSPDRFRGAAEVSFITASGSAEGPIWREGGLSFALGFRRSFIDLFASALIPDDTNLSFTTAPQYYDSQARIDWRPNVAHRVSLMAIQSSDRMEFLLDEENPQDRELTGQLDSEDGFWRLIATWQYRNGDIDATSVVGYGHDIQRRNLEDRYFYRLEPTSLTVRHDTSWRAHDRLAIKVGGDIQRLGGSVAAYAPLPGQEGVPGDSNFTTDDPITIDEPIDDNRLSAYLAADVKPIERLVLTPSARIDHFSHIGATEFLPRVSAAFRIADSTDISAATGIYARPLNYAEAVPDDLSPETAIHYAAGIEHHFGDGINASVSGFYNDFRDLVVRDPNRMDEASLDSYVNQGEGESYGAEMVLRLRRNRFYGWVAYTLSRSTRRDGAEMDERLFDWDQTHNLTAVASVRLGKWRLGGTFRYATGTPYTPIEGSRYLSDFDTYEPIYGSINSVRFDTSHQLDVRIDREWTFDQFKLSAFVDVTNVYANAPIAGYAYNFDYSEREEVSGLPILPTIGLRGEF